MTYPQFTDFNEALQNPHTAFTDAELQNAQADTNPLGLPVALGGGFTYTYPMTTPAPQSCGALLPQTSPISRTAIRRHLEETRRSRKPSLCKF